MPVIVDEIGEVVARMRGTGDIPYYLYGHRLEIANRLIEKDKDRVAMLQKYPLVALRQDIEEQYSNGIVTYTLNMAILEYTDKNYTAEQRYANVFKPILYPLYELLIKSLRESFFWPAWQNVPPHTKIDRPFWGVAQQEKNTKPIFNDPLDAIELVSLKISKRICN
jgi:hypothetical protein